MRLIRWRRPRAQALVEFALILPLFLLVIFSVIIFGLYIFYNQQLESAVREAARYASVHTSTAQCPTVSRIDPIESNQPQSYFRCDPPETSWPRMTAAARSMIWGMPANQVSLSACYSGLIDTNSPPNADVLPGSPGATFARCTMGTAPPVDPQTDPNSLACPAQPPAVSPSGVKGGKADGGDKASALAVTVSNNTHYPTTVTVYACYRWTPPMSGFIFIPSQITLRAVSTDALQRQQ